MEKWVGHSEAELKRKWKKLELLDDGEFKVLVSRKIVKIPDSNGSVAKDAIDKTVAYPTPDNKGFKMNVDSRFYINAQGKVEKWEIVKSRKKSQ